tara:strand:- start:42 stop:236 length:195 start_codon:yes stop_codon:yes gene_type:complete
MKIGLKSFVLIVMGLCLISLSIGYIFGYYIYKHMENDMLVYLAAPIIGLGSGMTMYGTLFGRKK